MALLWLCRPLLHTPDPRPVKRLLDTLLQHAAFLQDRPFPPSGLLLAFRAQHRRPPAVVAVLHYGDGEDERVVVVVIVGEHLLVALSAAHLDILDLEERNSIENLVGAGFPEADVEIRDAREPPDQDLPLLDELSARML